MNRASHKFLASQNAYYSETRVLMNTSVFGQALSANDTNLFTFSLDGVSNSAALTLNVSAGIVDGAAFASTIQAALVSGTGGSADIMVRNPNTGSAIVTADLTNITVKFDADTAELVFRDSAGRAMGFGYAGSATLTTLTGPISQEVTGQSNKGLTVQRDFLWQLKAMLLTHPRLL